MFHDADMLDARAFELEAEAASLHAKAARLRAQRRADDRACDDWIPIAKAQLAKKTARRLARTGVIAAKQVSGRWYLSRASLDAYLRDASRPAVDDEAQLRAELGLRGAA